ncbi:hypothetical protein EV182_000872 [Spiromyces aspiralis]|uniref:Uncharacterized protein n=1 Tax=Spiromyces aspiralis TaxID=68401 RepID=A0ACC1HKH5_9FUNG|nr:hypothetical protein EV182_000872 [Spiromyces aspiralis]
MVNINDDGQNFSQADIDRYKETFQLFDKDEDGYINRDELASTIRSLGFIITEAEIQNIFTALDKNGSGVGFPDFLSMMATKKKDDPSDEKELTATFKVLDEDGDGWISVNDFARALSTIGETLPREELEELVKAANVGGGGKLNYEEFVKLVKTM